MKLQRLMKAVTEFRDARDWEQFHTAKNLAMALIVETAELQEIFLWKDEDEAVQSLESDEVRSQVKSEIADVLIYALLFCDAVDADPAEVIQEKLEENERRYPADLARGRADKYTELDTDGEG